MNRFHGLNVLLTQMGSVNVTSTAAAHGNPHMSAYSTPEQLAATIVFAASRDAGCLTGAEVRVESGSHI